MCPPPYILSVAAWPTSPLYGPDGLVGLLPGPALDVTRSHIRDFVFSLRCLPRYLWRVIGTFFQKTFFSTTFTHRSRL